jgi:RsiW-degrading membrane proteinase PrsW (M82 family)/rRNA-processing protein FCF1
MAVSGTPEFSFVMALLIAVGVPGAFLLAIYRLDLYASRTFKLVLLSFGWGAVGSVTLAYLINTYITFPLLNRMQMADSVLYLLFAPLTEEIAKALALPYIRRQPEFTYFVDGAIYGFAAGIGFSIVEAFLYISRMPHQAVLVALSRGLSTCIMHGTTTGLIGAAVGRARLQNVRAQRTLVLGTLFIAVLIHALFNSAVLLTHIFGDFGVNIALGIAAIGFVALAYFINVGLNDEQRWIKESFDRRLMDLVNADLTAEERAWLKQTLEEEGGVTVAEVRASQIYQVLMDVLEPVARKFPKRAKLMESIVQQQTQIAIKRQVLQRLTRPADQKRQQAEIVELEARLKALRQEAGVYVNRYLQWVFDTSEEEILPCLETEVVCTEEDIELSAAIYEAQHIFADTAPD